MLELEADTVGAELAARAGFDVRNASSFFLRLEETLPVPIPELTSTHPDPQARCVNIRGRIYEEYDVSLESEC